ncbi:MAG: hypothetical protein Q4D62_08140 [Planctomycetia bacterium]|nr:hypothetical protein [Planctomycetia bacterium]
MNGKSMFACFLAGFSAIVPFSTLQAAPQSVSRMVQSTQAEKENFNPYSPQYFIKSKTQLQKDFATIRKMKIRYTGNLEGVPTTVALTLQNPAFSKKSERELRVLMLYRAVAGVPFEDLTLDRKQTAHAEAAAYLLHLHGSLSHTPPQPDDCLPEVYEFARRGTSCSNLYQGEGMRDCVRKFMDDSDPANIAFLGHRRWCLNPAMLSTGFGEFGKFAAMWSFDQRRKMVDYDTIAFPARGLTPVNLLEENWAWHISLHPKKYKLTSSREDIRVHISPAAFDEKTGTFRIVSGDEIPVDSVSFSTEGYGIPMCVIFRPQGITLEPGRAYFVEILGFSDAAGKAKVIPYWVLFCEKL